MAQYLTDFSDFPTGEPPANWRDAWIPGEHRLEVLEAKDATGGKVLRHRIAGQGQSMARRRNGTGLVALRRGEYRAGARRRQRLGRHYRSERGGDAGIRCFFRWH